MKNLSRSRLLLSIVLAGLSGTLGCFAHALHGRYAEQAAKAHSTEFATGSSRAEIIRALGNPDATRIEDSKKIDDYLLPNHTWHESYAVWGAGAFSSPSSSGDPRFLAMLLMIAIGVEIVVDPVMTSVYLIQGRDATKCEYLITYDKNDRAERIDVRTPEGFTPDLCPTGQSNAR